MDRQEKSVYFCCQVEFPGMGEAPRPRGCHRKEFGMQIFIFSSCLRSASAKVCWEILPSLWSLTNTIFAELQPEKLTLNLIPWRKATFYWDSLLLGENLVEILSSWEERSGEGKSVCLCRYFCCSIKAGTTQGRGAREGSGEFLGKPCLEDRS